MKANRRRNQTPVRGTAIVALTSRRLGCSPSSARANCHEDRDTASASDIFNFRWNISTASFTYAMAQHYAIGYISLFVLLSDGAEGRLHVSGNANKRPDHRGSCYECDPDPAIGQPRGTGAYWR